MRHSEQPLVILVILAALVALAIAGATGVMHELDALGRALNDALDTFSAGGGS